jgi:tetratricopeptide (TPR) repeat protein
MLTPKGEDVVTALLVEYYRELPQRQEQDPEDWLAEFQSELTRFKKRVGRRYTEGTLQRLLTQPDPEVRQAAVLALGMLGSMESNRLLARRLHDPDDKVRLLAGNALWAVWFRADSEDNNQELQRLVRLRDRSRTLTGLNALVFCRALTGLNTLIERAPRFAEAYNQRAILFYQAKLYEKAIADCETVLALNPYHFGAQVGMAQCLMQLRRHKAALRAFRKTLRLHPFMEGVEETIRALESALGEEGRRDDKK